MIPALLLLAAAASAPLKVLILTGQSDEPHHHWRETTASIRDILSRDGRFDVFVNEEPRAVTPESLAGYRALVVNYNGPRLPALAEESIESFVHSGGGMVAFHQSSYGPFFGMQLQDGRWRAGAPGSGWDAWPRMTGARWNPGDIGHATRGVFQARWKDGSPFRNGGPDAFQANDELYHKLSLLPGAQVEATALSPRETGGTGREEPLIWTNRFGKGRIFYTTLGHDAMAFYQAGMRNAFARGVEWAASGEVGSPRPVSPSSIRLLVVTGGHGYPVEFYAMLNSLPGVMWTHAASHEEAFKRPLESRFDTILLHDMIETTSPAARERLRAFVEAGRGVISLHHAIVDYTDWPWWHERVTGGKYFIKAQDKHPASRYHEDVDMVVTPVPSRRSHPVLAGVGPLTVHDEVYLGMWHSPAIDVLMETSHPENDRPVVYIGPHPRARVLYVQLGHSARTMDDPGFRRLMRNAVEWTARGSR